MQKNRLEKLRVYVFRREGKVFFDTIWRPHFPSGDHENISVAG